MSERKTMLENLERRLLEYENIREFLVDIRKRNFGGEDKKLVKVAELEKV